MLGNIRPLLKPVVEAIASPIARSGVAPNVFSVAAVPFAVGAAYAIVTSHWALALAGTVCSGLVDLLDGSVARLQGRDTPFGNYLDTMLDRIVEVSLFLGLAAVWPMPAATALAFSLLVSYAKARVALVVVTDDRDWPGMGDRADRIALLVLGLVFASAGFPGLLLTMVWVIAGMTIVGTVQRMIYAHRLIVEGSRGDLSPTSI